MKYWVTWSWRANDRINGILCDEIEIDEPITSVDVVRKYLEFHIGLPYSLDIDNILSWSKIEENVPTKNC